MTEKRQNNYQDVLESSKRAALYARYSTDEQDFIAQINTVKNFLEEYGFILTEEFKDPGVSAIKTPMEERPELQRLKRAALNKEFDFIAIYKGDRVARNLIEHQQLRKFMNDIGMPVVSVSDRQLYTSTDVISNAVKDGMSRMEYENIRERTSDTLKAMKQSGKWTGGKAPFGYIYDAKNKIFSIQEKEIQIVKELFEWFKLGYGFNEIVLKIKSELGIGVQKWNKDKVKMIITNPFYAGYLTTNRLKKNTLNERNQWILSENSTIEAIMTREEWEFVMQLYEKRKNAKHNPKRYSTPFLLRDIVKCKVCDTFLKTKNQVKRVGTEVYGDTFYYCTSKNCINVESTLLHEQFKSKVLTDLLSTVHNKAENKVKQELIKDQQKLENEIAKNERKVIQLNKEIGDMEVMLNKLFNRNDIDNEDNVTFLESLTFYQLVKKKEREIAKNETVSFQKKLQQIEMAIKYDFETNLSIELPPEGDYVNLRRMLLSLVSVIYIDKDGLLHIDVNQMKKA
ncbi:recombinase family protein [Gottfriedia acidiceleris]|uniref:recombinase family protein n=1 Tax=Gottfriedia acidiceleris TaxID=371036 RepID=UPI002FFF70CF